MNRRTFLLATLGAGVVVALPLTGWPKERKRTAMIEKIFKSDEEWRKLLTHEQYRILRKQGTERAGSSRLNNEHRKGAYVCAACDLDLFTSEMKFDSGTGWPSFYTAIEGHTETTTDYKLLFPRTEYHCARCGGHMGHIFDDGPAPTGQRWCNNGVALKFVPTETE